MSDVPCSKESVRINTKNVEINTIVNSVWSVRFDVGCWMLDVQNKKNKPSQDLKTQEGLEINNICLENKSGCKTNFATPSAPLSAPLDGFAVSLRVEIL